MESFLRDITAIFANPYVALIFLTALAFDFINGFHDAANSIATIVGTRVLRPLQAVLWALSFLGRRITWREEKFRVLRGGRLARI